MAVQPGLQENAIVCFQIKDIIELYSSQLSYIKYQDNKQHFASHPPPKSVPAISLVLS